MKSKILIVLGVVAVPVVLTPARTYSVEPRLEHRKEKSQPERPPAVLQRAIYCESQFQQFNPDGTPNVPLNENGTRDWGAAMLNDIWEPTAQKLHLDFKHSLRDNLRLALYVWRVQGIRAWVAYNSGTGKCVWEKQYMVVPPL